MKKSEALKVLGLSEGATDDEVKQAHRQKVRENHPDRFPDPEKKAVAEDKTKLINEARDVLLSRKWEPEFGPRASNYGDPASWPFTTYGPGSGPTGTGSSWPYGRPGTGAPWNTGTGQGGRAEWNGIPFTYVWTTWDEGTQENPFESWESVFFKANRTTPQEILDRARKLLSLDAKVEIGKLAILALCGFTGNLAIGMFTYALISILYGFYHNHQGCGPIVVLPLVMLLAPLATLFAPRAGVQITGMSLVFFAIAVYYNFQLIRRDYATFKAAKARVESGKG